MTGSSEQTHSWTSEIQQTNDSNDSVKYTSNIPLTINIHPRQLTAGSPENHLFEKEDHRPNPHFWVPCYLSRVYRPHPVIDLPSNWCLQVTGLPNAKFKARAEKKLSKNLECHLGTKANINLVPKQYFGVV